MSHYTVCKITLYCHIVMPCCTVILNCHAALFQSTKSHKVTAYAPKLGKTRQSPALLPLHPPPPRPESPRTSCLAVQPDLLGVIPVVEGQFTSLQKDAVWWPPRLRQAAAICNSLTFVRKNKVVGDMAELKLCQAVEAHFVVSLLFGLPSKFDFYC